MAMSNQTAKSGGDDFQQTGAFPLRTLKVESYFRAETRNLQRDERDRYGSFLWNVVTFDRGPKTPLDKLVGSDLEGDFGQEKEGELDASLDYYHEKRDAEELLRVLKFFCAYLMQQARKETDGDRQVFLAFKAVDMARMVVQYAPMSVHKDAEGLVFGVFIDLGSAMPARFAHFMHSEEQIYELMRRLQIRPHDIRTRMDMADKLAEQTSYIDALVQYQTLLKILHRRGGESDRSRAWVIKRVGDLFQDLGDHQNAKLSDGRKARNFIVRFNREFAQSGGPLPLPRGAQGPEWLQLRMALLDEANRWSLQAARSGVLDPRIRANTFAQVARNHALMGQPSKAIAVLKEGNFNWGNFKPTEASLREQVEYLSQAIASAGQMKDRNRAAWASKDLGEVQAKLSEYEKVRREKEALREQMLG